MDHQNEGPRIFSATVRGNSHILRDVANQDSFYYERASHPDRWAAAIADGHGSSAHPKSEIGSRLAVECAVETALEFLDEDSEVEQTLEEIREHVLSRIIYKWRSKIAALDVTKEEDTTARGVKSEISQDELIPYGTTLAFAFPYKDAILLGSIGDTDCFWRSHSGLVRSLDIFENCDDEIGEETHSLCQTNAKRFFIFKALPMIEGGSLFLATDGVKKSLRDQNSLNSLLDYYHGLASKNTTSIEDDLKEQLHTLTTEGSGDDCTAIILHFPASKEDETNTTTNSQALEVVNNDNESSSHVGRGEKEDINSPADINLEAKPILKKKIIVTLLIMGSVALILFWKNLYPIVPTQQMLSLLTRSKVAAVLKVTAQLNKKILCLQK